MAIHLVRLLCAKKDGAILMLRRYGTVYLFLQLVPPFSMFFLMTAAVSSALWASDLEQARTEQEANLVQASEYTDEQGDAV